ncbi:hypothetical protein A6A40_26935 (plasmid) [Azospirillum humicireducens]|uniref:Uncharacterized protein n=1 Tax=Azospirillum humicireducens TaxID=1226968 RepID=A0A2R4VWE9_9PROT|nr:hypothetical protein A6A40_26935 [Azospirillum humicireducens]
MGQKTVCTHTHPPSPRLSGRLASDEGLRIGMRTVPVHARPGDSGGYERPRRSTPLPSHAGMMDAIRDGGTGNG